MPSTGFTLAGTGANLTGVGTEAWANPGNVTADDGSVANANAASADEQTNYLVGSNFGFSIPAGATIDGIEARYQMHDAAGFPSATISEVRLGKDNTTPSDDLEAGSTALTSTPTNYTYGSSSSLWGLSWTPGEVNASTFQARISCNAGNFFGSPGDAQCDAIWVNVHYTLNNWANKAIGVSAPAAVMGVLGVAIDAVMDVVYLPPATYSYTHQTANTGNATSYTFNSSPIGDEAADRFVVVSMLARGGGSVSSFTINGVSASQIYDAGSGNDRIEFWGATVPTGTSVSIAITIGSAASNMAIGVWSIYGLQSTTPVDADVSTTNGGTISLDVPTGAVVIGASNCNSGSATTHSWTGLSENFDATTESGFTYRSGASSAVAVRDETFDVSCTWSFASATSYRFAAIVMR